jgi:hypothetical protein
MSLSSKRVLSAAHIAHNGVSAAWLGSMRLKWPPAQISAAAYWLRAVVNRPPYRLGSSPGGRKRDGDSVGGAEQAKGEGGLRLAAGALAKEGAKHSS